jgi:hypothetical protein
MQMLLWLRTKMTSSATISRSLGNILSIGKPLYGEKVKYAFAASLLEMLCHRVQQSQHLRDSIPWSIRGSNLGLLV